MIFKYVLVAIISFAISCSPKGEVTVNNPDQSGLGNSPEQPVTPNPEEPIEPPPPPPPPQTNGIDKTIFFFGSYKKIKQVDFDHAKEKIFIQKDIDYPHYLVGWMTFEPSINKLFIPSEDNLKVGMYSWNKSTITYDNGFSFLQDTVHLSILPSNSGYSFFGTSYNQNKLAHYELDAGLSKIKHVKTFTYPKAHTHSSAVDSKRNLVFAANMDLNEMAVFTFDNKALKELTTIKTPNPRILIYDSIFDKIYYSGESITSQSYFKIFETSGNVGAYQIQEVGSYAFGISGSDIKINHESLHAYVLQRENGKESLLAIPLTKDGLIDSNRKVFTVKLSCKAPRSLEVTQDGLFAAVACESIGTNLVITKFEYDANKQIQNAKNIVSRNIHNDALNGSASFTIMK